MPHHPAHTAAGGREPAAEPPPSPLAVAPGATIVFLGDSITAAQPGYLDVIRQALDHTRAGLRLDLRNAGVPGDTIRDLEARLERDVLAARPAWVIVGIGANDYRPPPPGHPQVPLPEFTARYRALIGRIQAAASGVVLLTIPVVGVETDEVSIPDPRAYNEAIRGLAAATGVRLVDIHRAFYEVHERAANYKQVVALTSDGIHPNSQGHALIARTILLQLGLLRK